MIFRKGLFYLRGENSLLGTQQDKQDLVIFLTLVAQMNLTLSTSFTLICNMWEF